MSEDLGKVKLGLATILAVALNMLSLPAQIWEPVNPHFVGFGPVKSSADGMKLFVGDYNPGFYVSTNGGYSWTHSVPFPRAGLLTCSADGSKLIAASDVFLAVSTNSGISWTSYSNPPYMSCVACSADGVRVIGGDFASFAGHLYLSTNSGADWTTVTNAPIRWNAVASSADGTKLAAAGPNGVYTSPDSGTTWISNDLPAMSWMAIAMSADGSKLVAGAYGGPICTSSNSGATWVSNNVPAGIWSSVASSADGTVLVATRLFEFLFVSTDSGDTWTSTYINQGVFQARSAAASADGNRLVAADFHNMNPEATVYIWQRTPTPELKLESSETNVLLSWLVPSTPFVLQQNSTLSPTNWVTLSNVVPTLNLTNLHNEVALPINSQTTFYRLATP